jgi:tetratricopeptide (TPR) repeat protein
VRCMNALQRRDRCAIITAYSRPSQKTLTDLGLDAEAVIETPYLTQEEANEVVRAADGDAEQWGRIAFASGAQGHPQLVHAFVLGMAARGWPASEMRDVVVRGFSSDDIEAERRAVRGNMVTALSESARDVLYRLSLVMGRFDRGLAITIAEVPPPIGRAGELLDGLIGAWIEVVGRDALRVSPLATNAGQGMLSAEAQRTVHAAIAIQMLSKRRIHAADADSILMHGLRGEEPRSLFRLSHAILTAEPKAIELLQDHVFILPILRTDQPIFRANSVVSLMLRLAQFKMVAAKQNDEQTAASAAALLREAAEGEPDRRELFEGLALGSILNTIGIASSVPNWIELLRRFQQAVNSSSIVQGFKEAAEKATEIAPTFCGVLFRIGSAQLRSVERLEELFADLDNLTDIERSPWLEGLEKASECSLLVNPPWTAEQRNSQLNAEKAADRYERTANLAQKWKYRALSIQCHIARAVMFDEYLNAKDKALGALDAAVGHFGEDVEISRARARIFWRNGNYHDAVAIMRSIADVVGADNPIDRAYALRQAAISAAKLGEWAEAADWFKDAEKAAASSGLDDMKMMAVGLEADRAVALLNNGDAAGALESMASCLIRLAEINPDGSLRAAYYHRVVRHAVLWMDTEIDKRERLIEGKDIEILPGACSNPEPPSLTDLPLAPLDAGWYMLTQAEISSGCDAGIAQSLRSQLEDGPILFMEAELRVRRLTLDIRNIDSVGFADHLLDYLSAMAYMHIHHRALGDTFNSLMPPRGEIPTLAMSELAEPIIAALAEDAVIAFGMSAAFRGVGNPFADLCRCLVEAFGPNIPGKAMIDRWQATDGAASDPILMIYSGEHMEPQTVWLIGLRLFQRIRQSALRSVLAPALKNWMLREWRRITTEETFRLSRPLQTVPGIEACLGEDKKSEALIASILLRSIDAVRVVLSTEIEQQLNEVASGTR